MTPSAPRRLDALLAVLVVAFAFLAASFAARNSDFWLHLASGRLLSQGGQTFGVDPFAYTTEGVYWANHAWLFDLALYAGYQLFGGAGLVALKAIGIAALAGLMLRLGNPRVGPFWVGAGCVLLAVLAMSPRLLLQPGCLSLLLLAVCLGLLCRGGRALYALPVVVALWVNLDAWFLLGPLVVVLFWLGGSRLPLWLLPACLAACLLSPYHVHGLTLPDELSPAVWRSAFRHDVRFAPLFASPWHRAPLERGDLSAWALALLAALGPVSFALCRPALRSWRLPAWLAFAALAAWQARLVPFFAVVAGPITALNLREAIPERSLARTGPLGLSLCTLLLLAFCYPGWLQGFDRRDRAVAWAVAVEPSLRRVAEIPINPPSNRAFAVHPDVAHYCAWFRPGEKCFLDSRLQLFLGVAEKYERICETLLGPLSTGLPKMDSDEISRLLDHYSITRVVVCDPDHRRLEPCVRGLDSSPGWSLLRVDGQALVVCWRPKGPFESGLMEAFALGGLYQDAGYTGFPFYADSLAFAPGEDEQLPPAPSEGPAALALPRPWWEDLLARPGGSTWEADAGAVYLGLFEASAERDAERQRRAVLARDAAGVIGETPLGRAARLALPGVFLADLRERSPALPLLGVRAARRGIASHPDDAKAWLVLAQSYLSLGRTTAEASPDAVLPPLAQVRYIQTVAALVQVVTLRPDLAVAHESLARLFAERGYLDLALKHREKELLLTRREGRRPGEDAEAFAGRIADLGRAVEQMRNPVQDAENRFIVRSDGLSADPLARARLALRLGLAGAALDDVLLRSSADLYGVEGIRLLVELLLMTGRVQEARELLDRDEMRRNPDGLGTYELLATSPDGRRYGYRFSAYDWFDLCQVAAAGDYDRAARALTRLRGRMRLAGAALTTKLEPPLLWHAVSELGLGASPQGAFMRVPLRHERERIGAMLAQSQFLRVERADLRVLEGMLALERGVPGEADGHFRRSLESYRQGGEAAPALAGKALAVRYRQRLRR